MATRGQDESVINQLLAMSPHDAAVALEASCKTRAAAEVEGWRLWGVIAGGRPGARERAETPEAQHLIAIIRAVTEAKFAERAAA